MKSIAFIIQNINNAAGTEKATVSLSNSLARAGFSISIISLESAPGSKPFFSLEKECTVMHQDIKGNYLKKWKVLRSYFKQHPADFIFGTGHNISFFLPMVRNRTARIFAIEHIDTASIPSLSRKLMALTYPLLTGVIALSDAAARNLAGLNKNISIIPNQIETFPNKSKLEAKNIIMVGRFSAEKSYDRVVPLAQFLQKRHPDWSITIFGGGESVYRKNVVQLFSDNNLTNIRVEMPVQNIYKEYLASSIYLITSRNEAMPLALLEAKSAGLPVIGYANQGVNALVKDNEDGFIVETEEALLQKIVVLIKEIDVRQRMAEASLRNIKQYSEEIIVQKWLALLLK